jgi:hypothetical protein
VRCFQKWKKWIKTKKKQLFFLKSPVNTGDFFLYQKNRPQILIILILLIVILTFIIYITVDFSPNKRYFSSNIKTEVNQDKRNLQGPITIGNATILPLANFQITGKILSRKKYYLGKESKFSPIDFAMGWGPMANQKVIDKIKISQRNRWYYWRTKEYPIPKRQISNHSANMHIIPADDVIKEKVLKAHKGNIVYFKGYLVKVIAQNWTWKSSLSRKDTGNHACEIVYVTEFEILQ